MDKKKQENERVSGAQRKKRKRKRREVRKGRKKKKEGIREWRRRGDLRNLMSIGPSNLSRSISNFDIAFYSTPKITGWSSMEISIVGFS